MKPIIIAGPCAAESAEIMDEVATSLAPLAEELDFDLIFKASFDKANRTSIDSYRGPGWPQAAKWFDAIKSKYGWQLLTDIHESHQADEVAEVIDMLQIPAFLCRQTDLMVAAVKTGRRVNVKKGQFMAPEAMSHIVDKARQVLGKDDLEGRVLVTERGTSFGYGDLVVDMRAFPALAASGAPVIFDMTHSVQRPAAGANATSGGLREHVPMLARSATATGHLSGYFLEVHPNPAQAISDKGSQLTPVQAAALLRQLIPMWRAAQSYTDVDAAFK